MALSPTGNKTKLLELQGQTYSFFLKGETNYNNRNILKCNLNTSATVIVENYNKEFIILKTLTDYGNLVENNGNVMMPCFYEDGQYQLVLETKDNLDYDIYHRNNKITDNFEFLNNVYFGNIEFSSDIGYTNIDIYKKNKK